MFIPNTFGDLYNLDSYNLFGEPDFTTPQRVRCAVVQLVGSAMKTSVRTDSSASRGNAEEVTATAKILFPHDVEVRTGDKFVIKGFSLRIQSVEPRYNVHGALDHFEVILEQWLDE